MKNGALRKCVARCGLGAGLLWVASAAMGGGSPEHALIVANPGSAESMYLANYYRHARNIPDANVLYIDPAAVNFQSFAGVNGEIDAVLGYLANTKLDAGIDYIVLATTSGFYVDAPGLVVDGCFPVARFGNSSAFALSHIRGQILAGNIPTSFANGYFSTDPNAARAFNSRTAWLSGAPSTGTNARRYFIGAQLGYTGANGNTLAEILANIDRSAAADGTHPQGTFYYMSTSDPVRNVRAPQFPASVNAINNRGGAALILNDTLPEQRHDILGVMTGFADPDVEGAPMTILPGAFCDHLTSWAATFDISSQTKISSWIRKGASGSAGTVEEPCNYIGKFPYASFHAVYFQGLSLGEAYLRSQAYGPFQSLLYGDPLTRPYATIPAVQGNAPGGTVSGIVQFTPSASTTYPGATVTSLELYLDGALHSTKGPGQPFRINTFAIADGHHELRILAYDNTSVRNVGRWIGSLTSDNRGRSVSLNVAPAGGEMTTLFQGTVTASGPGQISEVRLLHNGRVVAAGPNTSAALSAYGRNLGAGQSRVQAEVLYADGRRALSPPVGINVAYSVGSFSNLPPVAYGYTKRVMRGQTFVVELPARFDDGLTGANFELLTQPGQGTTVGSETKGYRIMTAAANACGQDQFTYRVTTPSGQSNTATVKLIYGPGPGCLVDTSQDGILTVEDFVAYQQFFAAGNLRADMDGNCLLNVDDFQAFSAQFVEGCP